MKTKIFIDGREGTTGLRIHERFQNRDDIELLEISSELRKDKNERRRLINESDITFLCLPDDAARESVSMIENENVRIIDPSTAHRTISGWTYGFPELSQTHRESITNGKRVAVPGCHATGFISLIYPLIAKNLISPDFPISCFSITGYSGGGNKMISEYDDSNRSILYSAPREYALSQSHKHLIEMKTIAGLKREPLFSPIVADYYNGMLVSIPFYTDSINGINYPDELLEFYKNYYQGQKFFRFLDSSNEEINSGFISSNSCAEWDGIELSVTGNKDRLVLSARFDNLGKGASGAAIQCLNLMLNCEETKGLHLYINKLM